MRVRTTLVKATDLRGERIRARCGSRPYGVHTLTVVYDYMLGEAANHARVARLLAHKVTRLGAADRPVPSLAPRQVAKHQRGYDWEVE